MLTQTERNLDTIFDIEPSDDYKMSTLDDNVAKFSDEESSENEVAEYRPQNVSLYNEDEIKEAEDNEIKTAVSDDYQLARDNLKAYIEKGNSLLDIAISVAESTEETKAIDSASKVLSQVAQMNIRMLDLTQKKQDVIMKTRAQEIIKSTLSNNSTTNTQDNSVKNITNNNIVFSGTTTDLAKMIANMKKENKTDENSI